jgi:hypothetical protein
MAIAPSILLHSSPRSAIHRLRGGRTLQNLILAGARAGSSNCFKCAHRMEPSLPLQQVRRLGFCKQPAPRADADLGPGDFSHIYASCRAAHWDSA